MSNIMWNRVHKLKVNIPKDVSEKDLDRAFETETGKDCDEAAKELSDKEFRRMMDRAIQRLREKKPLIAYA